MFKFSFKVTKRIVPVMTTYSMAGTVDKYTLAGIDAAIFSFERVGDNGGELTTGAVTAGQLTAFHWTAAAEL